MSSTIFFFFFIPLLAFILLAVNLVFAPHNPYQEKDSAFECGFSSFLGQNRTQFSISFFVFALLFLLFDLEILLIYPYLVSAYTNGVYGLSVMLIFLLALTLGFAFELGKKALSIDSRQISNVAIKQANVTSYLGNDRDISAILGKKSYSIYTKQIEFELLLTIFSFIRSIIGLIKFVISLVNCPFSFLYSCFYSYIESYIPRSIINNPLCIAFKQIYYERGVFYLLSYLTICVYYTFISLDVNKILNIFAFYCLVLYGVYCINTYLFWPILYITTNIFGLFSFILTLTHITLIDKNFKNKYPVTYILCIFICVIFILVSFCLLLLEISFVLEPLLILMKRLGQDPFNNRGPNKSNPNPKPGGPPNTPPDPSDPSSYETRPKKKRRRSFGGPSYSPDADEALDADEAPPLSPEPSQTPPQPSEPKKFRVKWTGGSSIHDPLEDWEIKARDKEKRDKWSAKNPGYGKDYYENNKEALNKRKRENYHKNKDDTLVRTRMYAKKHKDEKKQYNIEYMKEHKDEKKEYNVEYKKKNKDKINAKARERRKKKREAR